MCETFIDYYLFKLLYRQHFHSCKELIKEFGPVVTNSIFDLANPMEVFINERFLPSVMTMNIIMSLIITNMFSNKVGIGKHIRKEC